MLTNERWCKEWLPLEGLLVVAAIVTGQAIRTKPKQPEAEAELCAAQFGLLCRKGKDRPPGH
jgi:hypothetical protein